MLVELDAPDRPHIRRALASTIEELNALESKIFGVGPQLVVTLKS